MSVVQWKSWTEPHKMRLISGNPGQNLTSCAPSPEILDKTSQDAPHSRKSWTKAHKMRPIPGSPGKIPERNTRKDALLVGWLLLVPTSHAEAPSGNNKITKTPRIIYLSPGFWGSKDQIILENLQTTLFSFYNIIILTKS